MLTEYVKGKQLWFITHGRCNAVPFQIKIWVLELTV